jgi:hypothetical protein
MSLPRIVRADFRSRVKQADVRTEGGCGCVEGTARGTARETEQAPRPCSVGAGLDADYLATPQARDLDPGVGEARLAPVVPRDLRDAAGMRADPVIRVLTGFPRKLPDMAPLDGTRTSHRPNLLQTLRDRSPPGPYVPSHLHLSTSPAPTRIAPPGIPTPAPHTATLSQLLPGPDHPPQTACPDQSIRPPARSPQLFPATKRPATPEIARKQEVKERTKSRSGESNPGPIAYEAIALPLSYSGRTDPHAL